jgi:hypothetical protein
MKNLTNKQVFVAFLSFTLFYALLHKNIFTTELVGMHDWRQTQTQNYILNFSKEKNINLLNPKRVDCGDTEGIYRREFPFVHSIIGRIYKSLGTLSVLPSRLASFIISILTLIAFFKLLNLLFKQNSLALLGSWAFAFSPVFYYYSLNPLPDIYALFFSLWGVYFFFKSIEKFSISFKNTCFSAFFLGLGALSKLPYILYYAPVFVYFLFELLAIFKNNNVKLSFKSWVLNASIYLVFLIPTVLWYAWVIPQWDSAETVGGIFTNPISVSAYLDILQHNVFSVLPELLLNYASIPFFLLGLMVTLDAGYRLKFQNSKTNLLAFWAGVLALYILYELPLIGKIHDYYVMIFNPILFILATLGIKKAVESPQKALKIAAFIAISVLPITAFLRIQPRWNEETHAYNPDLVRHKTALRSAVPDSAQCVVLNDYSRNIFFYFIQKKGWCFDSDNLPTEWLEDMRKRGAGYLYSSSRKIDSRPDIQAQFEKKIGEFGEIHVYKLR